MQHPSSILSVENLATHLDVDGGSLCIVDGISLTVDPGQTVALVGESGCGKSVAALSMMGLLPARTSQISGAVRFEGQNLLTAGPAYMQRIRGRRLAMIFQEPATALNPLFSIGEQIAETIECHTGANRRLAREQCMVLLERVGIADPHERYDHYPHQLSGGMRQRVMMAMALSCRPALLIADEPTTALDVTTQAQIMNLLKELKSELGMGVLLITHDLAMVAEAADYVYVMYAGRIVEHAPVVDLFSHPLHPYTESLLQCIPVPGRGRLRIIPGDVPDPRRRPGGCSFHPRCALSADRARAGGGVEIRSGGSRLRVLKQCAEQPPNLEERHPGHWAACPEYTASSNQPMIA